MKHRPYLLPLIAIFLAVQACALPWTTAEETLTSSQIEENSATETDSLVVLPTKEPFSCDLGMIAANAYSIEFCYSGIYSNGYMQTRVPENPPSDDMPIWGVHPDMIELTLTNYPVDNQYHDPIIRIYPVAGYIGLEPRIQTIVDDLQALLTSQDPSPENIPFVPIFNAAQMMGAQVTYLDFYNGKGVRFITQYSQAAVPISNDSAFYAFIGLTDDGAYLISATLPVTHPLFYQGGMTEPKEGWEAFIENFAAYVNTIESDLANQPPTAFFPDLTSLDEMITSFLIPPGVIP